MENFQQVDLTNYATKLEVNNAKTDLQNKITTNTSNIAYLQKNTVNTTTDQTINGIKTFAYQIKANGGIINLVDPTNDTDVVNKRYVDNNTLSTTATALQTVHSSVQFIRPITVQTPTANTDAANKQYVDNRINQIPNGGYNVIFSNPNTFNNLQGLSPINISSNTTSNKPFIIQFDRKGNNGSKYEGTINYAFILPDINQAVFAGNTLWYNNTNKRFENGSMAGITILRTSATALQFTFQC